MAAMPEKRVDHAFATERPPDAIEAAVDRALADPSGWSPTDVTVTLGSDDPLSGVERIVVSIDGAPESTYGSPLLVSRQGTTTIEFAGIDWVGNREATRSVQVRVDKDAPDALACSATGAWRTTPERVTLTASDTLAGVASLLYRLDGGDELTYEAGGFDVAKEGTTTIDYDALDTAGNRSALAHALVRIDRSAPVVSDDSTSTWQHGPVSVHLSVEDTGCGTASVLYSLDGSEPTLPYGSSILVSGDGTTTLRYKAIDALGNTVSRTRTLRLDDTAPTAGDDAPAIWVHGPVSVHLSIDDTGCGVASVLYSLDGSEPTLAYGSSILVAAEGTTTLRYKAIDALGNTVSRMKQVRIDDTNPTASDDAPTTWVHGPLSVHLSIVETCSGVATALYSLDGSAPSTPYTGSIAISKEGTTTLRYQVTDLAGNIQGLLVVLESTAVVA